MKILKVKAKSVSGFIPNLQRHLKQVLSSRFVNNGYTHIQVENTVYVGVVKDDSVWLGHTVPKLW